VTRRLVIRQGQFFCKKKEKKETKEKEKKRKEKTERKERKKFMASNVY
jgi:hypothetical protein